jgi:hypothetical protein
VPFEFLTPDWVAAARDLHDEVKAELSPPTTPVQVNLVITGVPFDDGDSLEVHIDTSEGEIALDYGHLPDAQVTVTASYELARHLIVDRDPQAAMQAILGGKVGVNGDMTRLLVLAGQLGHPASTAAANRLRDLTL